MIEIGNEPVRAEAGRGERALEDRAAGLRWRLVARAAAECAARGWRRIALYGAGRHTRLYIRQPWAWHGVRVVGVVDDASKTERISGVPVSTPRMLGAPVDAVVVSSDSHEERLYARAMEEFGARGVPVVRIYGPEACWEDDERTVERLVRGFGVGEADARWLVANRTERHDATLPVLPPSRTELHLRRYELAAARSEGLRVLDAACGTGYGSALLMEQGRAAGVVGVDIDADTIAYAQRRFGASGARFRCASACKTGVADGSVDLVTSFETIEHVPEPRALVDEFARVLAPGGVLVVSTPNEGELTRYHAHSFSAADLEGVISERFEVLERLGQRAGDVPVIDGLPAGMFAADDRRWEAETLVVIAKRRPQGPMR